MNVNGMAVDTPLPVQTARVSAPVVTSTGVNDPATIARQQLQSAVPAPALLAAYSANVPQQPKPVLRSAQPASSQLAAQFIAQDTSLTEEDLSIFAPRALPKQTQEEAPEDDYLVNLKIARGDLAAGEAKPAISNSKTMAANIEASEKAQGATTTNSANAVLGSETEIRSGLGPLAGVLPTIFNRFIRKQTISKTQGVDAYQLAALRNALIGTKNVATPDL